ncbi:TIR domain-containing protein [Bradyrhizobium xenonodulans]|uniref:TIR domain-containing protein n=1 Tax=Bradyrhizobium xenonodulans TaxID=2736875 RepID=A0ABY7MI92_9BRAD|nr:TIR domain-containing protein [Bradyrhizobium xenonodulans]WBL78140.1 TIR domain-containing protein [Bradyrhizobium xenonodulans]
MARKIFFSFSYHDLWRVNVVRNSAVLDGISLAGFHDPSIWEETTKLGDARIKGLIDGALRTTDATVVLIGSRTADRAYVSYEIEHSIELGHAVLGVRINRIRDESGRRGPAGPVPAALLDAKAPIYDYEFGRLGDWIEEAQGKAKS